MAENLANDIETTLNGGITDVATAITVTSGTGFPAVQFRVRIDDELIIVTSKGAGTNWTVTRGAEGTTNVAHSNGATVTHVVTEDGLEAYINQRWAARASLRT